MDMSPSEKLFFIKSPCGNLASVLHEANSKKIVILAHGFTGSKHESGRLFVTAARSLAASGFNALRFDFTGSGDSSGEFNAMTPNTEIADLLAAIGWAKRHKYSRIGLLGLSMGGAVSICAASRSDSVDVLVTWSTVPEFGKFVKNKNIVQKAQARSAGDLTVPGRNFYSDLPEVDVPEAFCSLSIPKLQIQGDNDLPGFREGFARYFPKAMPPKKHLVIQGGDHVFTRWSDRRKVISSSVKWFEKYL